MPKKIKSIAITQYDYIIRDFRDEELDIHGHPHHFTEFDRNGHPLKEIKYDRKGDFEEMFSFEYDEKGLLVRESYYPEEDMAAEETTYEWDSKGLLVNSIKHYLEGSADTTTYFYDDNHRLVKKITASEDEEPQEEIFEYEGEPHDAQGIADEQDTNHRITRNENGQVILEEVYSDEEVLLTKIERKFNEDGNPSEVEIYIDGQGKTISRHYFLHYDYIFFED